LRHLARGSTVAVVAGIGLALAASLGLVADIGLIALERARLQAAADAGALAGALVLANGEDRARQDAGQFVAANGYSAEGATVAFPHDGQIKVVLRKEVSLLIPSLLVSAPVPVAAEGTAAADSRFVGGARPFGVPESNFTPGGTYVLKAGPQGGQHGNYRALALDGVGTPAYVDAIRHGAVRAVHVDDWLSTKPGNMKTPTEEAIDDLMATTSIAVGRVFDEDPGCSFGNIYNTQFCKRLVVAVLVDPLTYYEADGRKPVKVAGFARFYLQSRSDNGEVYGRFVDRVSDRTVAGRTLRYWSRLVQ
jgi:hypothetical protein